MAGASAWAQTWGGGASGQWTTATNWSVDSLLTASSDVVCDTANAAITLSNVKTVNKLTIKANTTFTRFLEVCGG